MLIEWTEDLATGNEQIDEQHKEMFRRFARFQTACEEGKGKEDIYYLLAFLEEYIASHLSLEEELQVKVGYPGYDDHKSEHIAFYRQLKQLKDYLATVGSTNTLLIEINLTLINWLIRHIKGTDRAFAEFLQKTG
jgi:hemerythrin